MIATLRKFTARTATDRRVATVAVENDRRESVRRHHEMVAAQMAELHDRRKAELGLAGR